VKTELTNQALKNPIQFIKDAKDNISKLKKA
jgi:hypothetical protein